MEAIGILYLAILFVACFVFVHMVKLAVIGFKSVRKKPEEKPQPEPEKKKEPQPVYYIVEKKRARSKATYSKPREIKFKDDK
ncbi:MAG TPA: hypothetical protein IAB25_05905 [Candidatus Coproplasma stercoravium]|nr:hypothetical protein [Candidatus Coproplasma stercoravium]